MEINQIDSRIGQYSMAVIGTNNFLIYAKNILGGVEMMGVFCEKLNSFFFTIEHIWEVIVWRFAMNMNLCSHRRKPRTEVKHILSNTQANPRKHICLGVYIYNHFLGSHPKYTTFIMCSDRRVPSADTNVVYITQQKACKIYVTTRGKVPFHPQSISFGLFCCCCLHIRRLISFHLAHDLNRQRRWTICVTCVI